MELLSYFKIALVLLVTINYKRINLYKIPIKLIKYYKYYKNYNKIKKENIKKLIFVKDGEEVVIYDLLKDTIIKNNLSEEIFRIDNFNQDFIIYNDNNNLVRLKEISDYFNMQEKGYNKKPNLFLCLKLIYYKKDERKPLELNIDLKKNHFFIENNILFDYSFIKWYSKKFLDLELNKDDNYHYIFIDNSIKEYKLNKYNKVIITEDYFTIEDDQYYLVE